MNDELRKALRDFPRIWQRVTESKGGAPKSSAPYTASLKPRQQSGQKRCRQRFCP